MRFNRGVAVTTICFLRYDALEVLRLPILVQSVGYVLKSKGQRSFRNGLLFDECNH